MAHSDSIHMSTWPEGNLIAVWIALDDIDETNGPVYYYPGTHKWPYVYNEDLNLRESAFLLDRNPNQRYEQKVTELLEHSDIKPVEFHAKKGDVLIWHANLLHGGAHHVNKERTRKSMVIHYFAEGVICYHELTQRPAIFRN